MNNLCAHTIVFLLIILCITGCANPVESELKGNSSNNNTEHAEMTNEELQTPKSLLTPSPNITVPATIVPEKTPSLAVVPTVETTNIGYQIIPIETIDKPYELTWVNEGRILQYSIRDSNVPAHRQYLLPYQTRGQYDIVTNEFQILPAYETRITNDIRESIRVCLFPLDELDTNICSSNIHESPNSNRIVFMAPDDNNNIKLWLADDDGANTIQLDIDDTVIDVIWSPNGEWLLLGFFAGTNGSHIYYLVSTDGIFVQSLEILTDTNQHRIQGTTPKFSPDGQYLAFAGIPTGEQKLSEAQINQENEYNTYLLDLTTLKHKQISSKFGRLQWHKDGTTLYILDGAANTDGNLLEYVLDEEPNWVTLYAIDTTESTYPQYEIATDIPWELPYVYAWAYSPESNVLAGQFNLDGEGVVGIVFLSHFD